MNKIFIVILGVVVLCFSCKPKKTGGSGMENTENTSEVSGEDAAPEEISEDEPYTFTTQSGKKFRVKIDTSAFSLQNIELSVQGFEEVNTTFTIHEIDPVEDIFLADLNRDGFEEIYITTRSVGSGGYSTLIGYSSNKDKSVSRVFVPDLVELDPDAEGWFEGFQGHNTYGIEDGVMVNSFPVYLPGDANASPSGGERKVIYRLEAGESGWALKPVEEENIM